MALKILLIRFSSIGDIVLTTPVIRCIKTQIPNAEIHYLTKQTYSDLLKSNPYISKLITIEHKIGEVIGELKKEKYDYIIDLHNNLRSLLVKKRLGVKASSFKKLNIEKWIAVNFKINKLPAVHIVDRYLQTADALGVANDNKGLDFFIDIVEQPVLDRINLPANSYVVFAIGAKLATKRLPNNKIISIISKIGKPVVLIGGKEDAANAAEIASKTSVLNLCGQVSLQESAVLVKHAHIVITHDSGMMHIASAFHKKIISVWGNTIPQFGMYPYLADSSSKIVEVKNLSCRPCSKIGYSQCPKKHFKCMNEIDENEILAAVTSTS